MSSQIIHTFLYTAFVICFMFLALQRRTYEAAEMFEAAIEPFRRKPFSSEPRRTMKDVSSGLDVKRWLDKVFVGELFADFPTNGESLDYCSEAYPCVLEEGFARANTCALNLVVGDRNCPSYMPAGTSCCEQCQGEHCQLWDVATKQLVLGNTTAVDDLSANCADDMPSWYEDLDGWISEEASPSPPSSPQMKTDFQFCPERVPKISLNMETGQPTRTDRPLMLSQYNRVLMGRMTLKRVQINPNQSPKFINAYPATVKVGQIDAWSESEYGEDIEAFGINMEGEPWRYQSGKGFNSAGGFVHMLQFTPASRIDLVGQIAKLDESGWFDLKQGSFVVDLLLFNGNTDMLMYVAFIFEHTFSGDTETGVHVSTIDVSLNALKPFGSVFGRWLLYSVALVLFLFFVKEEWSDMSCDGVAYFSNFMSIIQVSCLLLFGYSILRYLMLVGSNSYVFLEFPFPEDHGKTVDMFQDLVNLCMSMNELKAVLAFNTWLSIVRLVSLFASLAPSLGIVFNVIHAVRYHLIAYLAIFVIVTSGFAVCCHLLFGIRLKAYSSIWFAFLTTITQTLGDSGFEDMVSADATVGFCTHIFFQLVFVIVRQPLLSMIILGYAVEKQRVAKLSEVDRHPLQHIIQLLVQQMWDATSFLRRYFVGIAQALVGQGGSGGNIRINYDLVARLRDKRPTRPRTRTVQYNAKGDATELVGMSDPSRDITLRADDPFYPNGLMQYYVEKTHEDGMAEEASVLPGYRLVGITARGALDNERFRDYDRYHGLNDFGEAGEKASQSYNKNAKRILEDLKTLPPVALHFEGPVKPYSIECVALLLFAGMFVSFATEICQIESSITVQKAMQGRVSHGEWYEYDPLRVSNFHDITSLRSIPSWLDNLVDYEYHCVGRFHSDGDFCNPKTTEKIRDEWFLYSGPDNWAGEDTYHDSGGNLPLTSTPAAVEGFSLGFAPLTSPARPEVSEVKVKESSRIEEYNTAVGRNNHIRLTIQVACFEENTKEAVAADYPFVLTPTILRTWGCSHEGCMKGMIKKNARCLDSEGASRDLRRIVGSRHNISYMYTDAGSYAGGGGIVIGFGATQAEAKEVMEILGQDLQLQSNLLSLVFEMIHYNGNQDLFAYSTAVFNMFHTGRLASEFRVIVFPMNLFANAGFLPYAIAGYAGFMLLFTFYMLADLLRQYRISKELQRPLYKFLLDWIHEDWWNAIDAASTVLNFYALYLFFAYLTVDASYDPWSTKPLSSFTLSWAFRDEANLATPDHFLRFHQVAELFETFQAQLAFSGLFLFLRIIKYFGAIPALRLMMDALGLAFREVFVIALIIVLQFIGFLIIFYTRYGVLFHDAYGSILDTASELFLYLCASFHITQLMDHSMTHFPAFFLIFLVLFEILFTTILAAIVYQWKVTRRDAQEMSLTRTTFKFLEAFQPAKAPKDTKKMVVLDKDFWQRCSVLHHLDRIDESGKVRHSDHHAGGAEGERDGRGDEGLSLAPAAVMVSRVAGTAESAFAMILKKAHMEAASGRCRQIGAPLPRDDLDSGAGVGEMVDPDEAATPSRRNSNAAATAANAFITSLEDLGPDEDAPLEIGIVEGEVDEERAGEIYRKLDLKLHEDASPVEEVWLDALVTVLEELGTLKALQQFFLPPPIIMPRKPQEWGHFAMKKVKMERRLDLFLRWLKEETTIMHLRYLKSCTAAKERVLKQQSLVLADYLGDVDRHISELDKDIKQLERRNSEMYAHASPLIFPR
eukprot:TRINITY_DN80741_c0_g1_i1.p1 TRINITY_DN80741_c0_g1~~TRINITY_DN80741_c0_g1_i1.p1  ORF type:complete len:1736 (-),score=254.35 TRINITY_DN80741_c0_g1_i1:79-5286(-)